jgi:glucose/mannose-6-phosphate isomerase
MIGSGIRASIEALPRQIRQGWELGRSLTLPKTYHDVDRVVISGMGGSSLGGHVLATSCADRLSIPVELVNGYDLPKYVDRRTLVVLSSYSGTTEETLATAKQAAKKRARCVVLTADGELAKIAKTKRWPLMLLDTEHNPSNQPRMGIGSSAMALHGLLASLGRLTLSPRDVERAAKAASTDVSDAAQTLATRIGNRVVLLLAAEHLVGAAHVMTNQVNENAKRMAMWFALPEFNHHFLEALSFPEKAKRDFVAILFQSDAYHPQNRTRVTLTGDLLAKHGIEPVIVTLDRGSNLEEAWRLIRLGASTSLDLALASSINPEPVPNVEAFKKALADTV